MTPDAEILEIHGVVVSVRAEAVRLLVVKMAMLQRHMARFATAMCSALHGVLDIDVRLHELLRPLSTDSKLLTYFRVCQARHAEFPCLLEKR